MNTRTIIHHSRRSRSHFVKRSASLPVPIPVMDSIKTGSAQYSSVLVHEVRNPLCNITLACDALKLTSLDEEQRICLNIIARGAARINHLIDTLLKSGRSEKAKYEVYSLHQLLEEVLDLAKDRISLKQVAISKDYTSMEHAVLLDIEKMKIALTNIVNNAIDAMEPGNGQLKLVTRSVGETIAVEIQDNGRGIKAEHLERIFEPYFTNKAGGMGLGLSATLDILRANHARVSVRSEEGLGTCFTLSFARR